MTYLENLMKENNVSDNEFDALFENTNNSTWVTDGLSKEEMDNIKKEALSEFEENTK